MKTLSEREVYRLLDDLHGNRMHLHKDPVTRKISFMPGPKGSDVSGHRPRPEHVYSPRTNGMFSDLGTAGAAGTPTMGEREIYQLLLAVYENRMHLHKAPLTGKITFMPGGELGARVRETTPSNK